MYIVDNKILWLPYLGKDKVSQCVRVKQVHIRLKVSQQRQTNVYIVDVEYTEQLRDDIALEGFLGQERVDAVILEFIRLTST